MMNNKGHGKTLPWHVLSCYLRIFWSVWNKIHTNFSRCSWPRDRESNTGFP